MTTQIELKKAAQKPINISNVLVVRPPQRSSVGIDKLKNAISSADRGRRSQLYDLYEELIRDPVLGNAIEKRINAITNAELLFQTKGKENEEISDLIDSIEFEELLKEILLSKMYGKSVIELAFTPKFKVVSIKRQHLNTQRREIVREVFDETGIPYEDNDFLLNIGKNDDLGLLLKVAPYAIYKRNGWGDFAQFVELYGIDTLLGLYDPDDENGRQEMEQAFRNRGSAGSMTMSKNGDVKTIGTKSTGTVDIHDKFLDKCDNQMLIAILGQTMTTKDGSSLSQSKTHAQTEDDINQADRRFIQRILNTELLPRLEKRGYPVAGGFFHFAEKGENLTKEQELNIAEKVEQITGQVDEQYWFENFGIPKGKKQVTNKQEPSNKDKGKGKDIDEKEEQKRSQHFEIIEESNKSLLKRLLGFFVKAPNNGATYGARLSNSTTNISIEKLLQKALLEIYNGDTELVNRLLFEINNNRLQDAINLAFQEAGEDWRIENSAFINEFRYNTAVFAAFKNHQQTKELIEELIDENGELRSFREFRKATKNIVKDYNERWLQTEYNTAVRSARSAVKWKDFLKTEHLYPNLEYMTSRATHKREAHLGYVGTILPIRHPWWDTHLPPSGWNCKCSVRPTDKEPTGVPNAELVSPVFAGNPGKTAEFVNTKQTPYYLHTAEELRKKVEDVAKEAEELRRRIEQNKALYDALDDSWEKIFFDEKKGGYLAIDKKRIKAAELSKNEQKKLHKEKRVATVYAQNGNRIELWEEDLRLSSPDGSINNVPMDLKSLESHNNIIKYAKKAIRKQGAEIVLFEFETINKSIHKELNKLTDLGIKYQYFARNKKKVYRNY